MWLRRDGAVGHMYFFDEKDIDCAAALASAAGSGGGWLGTSSSLAAGVPSPTRKSTPQAGLHPPSCFGRSGDVGVGASCPPESLASLRCPTLSLKEGSVGGTQLAPKAVLTCPSPPAPSVFPSLFLPHP